MPALIPNPTFRLDLLVETARRDGGRETFWMHYPGVFSARTVECALAKATEAACEEVLRISKRPQYDLMTHLGAEWHLLNVRFKRIDVEDEDDGAIRESSRG
jgi:hypothetical protein